VNEGQRALHKSGVKQATICEKLKKSRSTVGDWFTGKSRPGEADSVRLDSWLGITPAMFRTPCGKAPAVVPRPASKALANLTAEPHETKAAVDFHASGRTDGLWPEIDRLREMTAQPNLAPRDRASALSAIGRLLSKQTEIDCSAADLEHGWAKSESFRVMCRALYDALQPWPEALDAAREVLG
jgi:hypothetical protein